MDSLDKFNAGSLICKGVLDQLLSVIIQEKLLCTLQLSKKGDDFIKDALKNVYKNSKNKMIGFPVSISLNNFIF